MNYDYIFTKKIDFDVKTKICKKLEKPREKPSKEELHNS